MGTLWPKNWKKTDVFACNWGSYPHHLVNSRRRDMCYIPMESCFQGLSFIYLHLRPLNNLWGHYDPITENMARFFTVSVSFLHLEWSAMPLLKDLIDVFISFSWAHELWAFFQDVMTKNMKILWWISSLSLRYLQTLSIQDSELKFPLQLAKYWKLCEDHWQANILNQFDLYFQCSEYLLCNMVEECSLCHQRLTP